MFVELTRFTTLASRQVTIVKAARLHQASTDSRTKCYAGTCSKSKLNTTRKRETASAKATAKASTVYKTYASSSSRNVWLKLWVGKNKATITKN